jgi:transaldolase
MFRYFILFPRFVETVTNDILKKLMLVGYDLEEYSLDTVKMFYNDAVAAGFNL